MHTPKHFEEPIADAPADYIARLLAGLEASGGPHALAIVALVRERG